ncbi:hypothetical protein EDB81DRAFT_784556 [Dactylonectria macrodidyma]|uniref:Uncharacterized protein n=1 Tax=Dactylonectria macrodidyma TaxID=307937 RepID=A0A9P9FHV0_9HYPO|nr:hypothetical protein EDB81DRAFT_784556 [Dactylonectria macrodidyma]
MATQPSSSSFAANPTPGLFIVSTSLDKPDKETRKFIRSHVMRGKNTRKSKRTKEVANQFDSLVQDASEDTTSRGLLDRGQHGATEWILMPPQKVASELRLYGFAEEMRPYMLDLIQKAFTIVKPSTYTIEVTLVESQRSDMLCFANFSQHPALLHSILFTAQAFCDLSLGHIYGKTARFHLAKTLYHLQQCIQNDREATTESTMIVVVSLATAAAILGDIESLGKHLDGLHRMIEMRGGLHALSDGVVKHKAQRIDFGLAMSTGCGLKFPQENISWSPQVAQGVLATKLPELSMIDPRPDPRLLHIWADLRVFSRAANEASVTGVKMSGAFFSRLNTSVPSRLIALRFDPASVPELLRLCMLAYMKSLLIQIDGLGPRMTHLVDGLTTALQAQQIPPAPEQARLLLWTLFIAKLSIFEDSDQDWLQEAMVQTVVSLDLRTWQQTRVVLKSFLWVDLVYNQPGKRLFDQWLRNDRNGEGR